MTWYGQSGSNLRSVQLLVITIVIMLYRLGGSAQLDTKHDLDAADLSSIPGVGKLLQEWTNNANFLPQKDCDARASHQSQASRNR